MFSKFTPVLFLQLLLALPIFSFYLQTAEVKNQPYSLICPSLKQTAQYVLEGKISKEKAQTSLPSELRNSLFALIETNNNLDAAIVRTKILHPEQTQEISLLMQCGGDEKAVNEIIKMFMESKYTEEVGAKKDPIFAQLYAFTLAKSGNVQLSHKLKAVLDANILSSEDLNSYIHYSIALMNPDLLMLLLNQKNIAINLTSDNLEETPYSSALAQTIDLLGHRKFDPETLKTMIKIIHLIEAQNPEMGEVEMSYYKIFLDLLNLRKLLPYYMQLQK